VSTARFTASWTTVSCGWWRRFSPVFGLCRFGSLERPTAAASFGKRQGACARGRSAVRPPRARPRGPGRTPNATHRGGRRVREQRSLRPGAIIAVGEHPSDLHRVPRRCEPRACNHLPFEASVNQQPCGFELGGRVAPGGRPPGAPTDPDVRNSRIRLLGLMGSLRAVS
jgi:hypothetical protein